MLTVLKHPIEWGFIACFSLGSLATTVHGFLFDGWWGSFGLVLFMTSLIMGVTFANSPADTLHSQSRAHAAHTTGSAEFFPSGAIAFFLSLIVFFAAVWMALYLLMIYRQGGL